MSVLNFSTTQCACAILSPVVYQAKQLFFSILPHKWYHFLKTKLLKTKWVFWISQQRNALAPYCHQWSTRLHNFFSILPHKWYDVLKTKLQKTKWVFWFSQQLFFICVKQLQPVLHQQVFYGIFTEVGLILGSKCQLLRWCSPLWSCRCSGVVPELDFLPVILEASGGCCWVTFETFLILRRTERDMIKNLYVQLKVQIDAHRFICILYSSILFSIYRNKE
jgi:hypothetical protein